MEMHYIYSPDEKQCITFIDAYNSIYIYSGYITSVPTNDYVRIKKDKESDFGQEFVGCWRDSSYEWKIMTHESFILENKLDTTRFAFINKLPINPRLGIPRYDIEGCFNFGTYYYSVAPEGSAIVK